MSITDNIADCKLRGVSLVQTWGRTFTPQNVFLLISSSADLMRPMYIMEGNQGSLLLQSNGL